MEPFKFKLDGNTVEVKESLSDMRTAVVNVYDKDGKFIEEVTDKDKKYRYLAIARSEKYDRIMFPNGHHTVILFDDGEKSVDEFEYFDHFRFLDRFFYMFKRKSDGIKMIGLQVGRERFVCIEDINDPTRSIGKIMKCRKVDNLEEDIDIDPEVAKTAIGVIESIDKKFKTGHPEYSDDRLNLILHRKHII